MQLFLGGCTFAIQFRCTCTHERKSLRSGRFLCRLSFSRKWWHVKTRIEVHIPYFRWWRACHGTGVWFCYFGNLKESYLNIETGTPPPVPPLYHSIISPASTRHSSNWILGYNLAVIPYYTFLISLLNWAFIRVNPDTIGCVQTGEFDLNALRVDGESFESGKKKLRIKKYPDTRGRGINYPLREATQTQVICSLDFKSWAATRRSKGYVTIFLYQSATTIKTQIACNWKN